jgi:hypothetical protein
MGIQMEFQEPLPDSKNILERVSAWRGRYRNARQFRRISSVAMKSRAG